MTLNLIIFLILTYLICSIPFGLLISKFFGKIDIREHGSKNIGATNVTRVLGKKFGLPTFILDGGKGILMILFAKSFFTNSLYLSEILALTLLIAVTGHIYSIYLKFSGGKGVATTISSIFFFDPISGLVISISWVIIFIIFRISAVSALSSILILNIFNLFYVADLVKISIYLLLLILIFIKHIDNIEKIINERGAKNK